MKRKRINTAAICSSENYESSKRAHSRYVNTKYEELLLGHEERAKCLKKYLESPVEVEITITYTEVCIWGKWVPLGDRDPESFKGFKMR